MLQGDKNFNNKKLAVLISLRRTYKNDRQNTIFEIYNEYMAESLKDNAWNFYNVILNNEEFIKIFLFDVFYVEGVSIEEIKNELKGA